MDQTDKKILHILQNQGRISMKELGQLVSLTPPAVTERVKKLEEKGYIIGYRAVVNPEKFHKKIKAFVSVDMEPAKYKKFLEYAKSSPYIFECHHVVGSNCLILKVMAETTEELEQVIDTIKESGRTQTSVILSSPIEHKVLG